MLSDVCGAWNADKTVNLLVIKQTLLASILSAKMVPASSPICSGHVQWEHKRGKWSKRWLELREHSLWLSKRDTVRVHPCLVRLCAVETDWSWLGAGQGRDVLVLAEQL